MKLLGLLSVSFLVQAAWAQTPALVIKFDLRPTLITSSKNATALRFYDILARTSTVGIALTLEPGLKALLTERLQRIGRDDDLLDEAYLEDPGNWRVGKQYLPFGARNIIRDDAVAIRLDTRLSLSDLKAILAYCDNGPGQTRGGVVRFGSRLGLSFAYGHHFTIYGTSLAQVRDPERALGKGTGYRWLAGVDYGRRVGELNVEAEFVLLRQGESEYDPEEDISDLKLTYNPPSSNLTFIGAWSREWIARNDFYRFEAEVPLSRNVQLIPFVRFAGLSWKDLGVSARIKF